MIRIKEILKSIKELGHFYIMLIPERSSKESRSHKFSPLKIFSLLIIYTLFIGFISFLVLRISPVDTLIFGKESGLNNNEKEMVSELDQKMKFLTDELHNLRSYNSRLQLAIMRGDSTILDSSVESSKFTKNKTKAGGNIFAVFKELISVIIGKDEKNIFFIKPVNGFISRDFYPDKGHMGLDYIVKTGTPVYSSANGYILFADYTERDGYKIIINHPDNFVTIYKHCSYLVKKEKEKVTQGEIIALSGNTGEITTGPHLHFEIWHDGKPVNPQNLLIDY